MDHQKFVTFWPKAPEGDVAKVVITEQKIRWNLFMFAQKMQNDAREDA